MLVTKGRLCVMELTVKDSTRAEKDWSHQARKKNDILVLMTIISSTILLVDLINQ